MQHRQTSELGPFVSWREISTIVQLEDRGLAPASSGILLVEPKGLSKKPGGVTRRRPQESSNNLIEHEDAPPDIYAASGPA